MYDVISQIYPGKKVQRILLLKGVEIPDLETFTSILKTDEELTLSEFKKNFSFTMDGFTEEEVEKAFNTTTPLDPKEIFTERFSNVEVRAAIIEQCSPAFVFGAVTHVLLDTLSITKTYPRVKIFGEYGKPKNNNFGEEDIEVELVTRKEEYQLIQITSKELITLLPWHLRSNYKLYMLIMKCPSSGKVYYEWIDAKAIRHERKITRKNFFGITSTKTQDLKGTGLMVKQALCWQMTKEDGTPINEKEYDRILSET